VGQGFQALVPHLLQLSPRLLPRGGNDWLFLRSLALTARSPAAGYRRVRLLAKATLELSTKCQLIQENDPAVTKMKSGKIVAVPSVQLKNDYLAKKMHYLGTIS